MAGTTVKDPASLPLFADTREEQIRQITGRIETVPEKPQLIPDAGTPEHAEYEKLVRYIKENVTDTVTTLLTQVRLPEFDEAFQVFYAALDRLDGILSEKRFLLGDFVSTADVDLFVTLLRFDSLYSRQLVAVKKRIVDYENLWGYARDLYQIPAFRASVSWKDLIASVSFEDEKSNYSMNPFYDSVLPATDLDAVWESGTERAYLSSDPTHVYLERENRRFER